MQRSSTLVEVHYAIWGVLSVPFGFAGLFFLLPGLQLRIGLALLAVSALMVIYVAKLSQGMRAAWLLGVAAHAALIVGAVYYVPRWPDLLAWPTLGLNLYSLFVLLAARHRWLVPSAAETQPA